MTTASERTILAHLLRALFAAVGEVLTVIGALVRAFLETRRDASRPRQIPAGLLVAPSSN